MTPQKAVSVSVYICLCVYITGNRGQDIVTHVQNGMLVVQFSRRLQNLSKQPVNTMHCTQVPINICILYISIHICNISVHV